MTWSWSEFVGRVASGLVSGGIFFFVGLHWEAVKSFLTREKRAFRRLFGPNAMSRRKLIVTLDTYSYLPPSPAQDSPVRYIKKFPDGHITFLRGAKSGVMGYCSARGASYLIRALSRIIGHNITVASDEVVSSTWEGCYINLGSSYSNVKTNDIKHMPENVWLENDAESFKLKNGTELTIDGRSDKGVILKVNNPYCKGYGLLVCAGLGEWGTSGAAWYLAEHWKELEKRFGKNSFALFLSVTPGNDESALEMLSFGEETWRARLLQYLRPKRPRVGLAVSGPTSPTSS